MSKKSDRNISLTSRAIFPDKNIKFFQYPIWEKKTNEQ